MRPDGRELFKTLSAFTFDLGQKVEVSHSAFKVKFNCLLKTNFNMLLLEQ